MPAGRVNYWKPSSDMTAATRFEHAKDLPPSTARPSWDSSNHRGALPRLPRGGGQPPRGARPSASAVRLPAIKQQQPQQHQQQQPPVQSVADFMADPNGQRAATQEQNRVDQLLHAMGDMHEQMRSMREEHERQMHEMRTGMQSELAALKNALYERDGLPPPTRLPPLAEDALVKAREALGAKEAECDALRHRLSSLEKGQGGGGSGGGGGSYGGGGSHGSHGGHRTRGPSGVLPRSSGALPPRGGMLEEARREAEMLEEEQLFAAGAAALHGRRLPPGQPPRAASFEEEEARAATQLQAHARGRHARANTAWGSSSHMVAEPPALGPAGNDDVEHDNVVRLQAHARGRQARQGGAARAQRRMLPEAPSDAAWEAAALEAEQATAASQLQAIQRGRSTRKAQGEQAAAAAQLQAAHRGHAVRKEQGEQAVAAAQLQAVHRGRAVRTGRASQAAAALPPPVAADCLGAIDLLEGIEDAPASYGASEAAAATRVQAIQRGHTERARVAAIRGPPALAAAPVAVAPEAATSVDEQAAATKLQAIQRGHTDRAKVAALRTGPAESPAAEGMAEAPAAAEALED